MAEQRSSTGPVLCWDTRPGEHRPLVQRERSALRDAAQADVDERFYAIVTDLVGAPTELVGADGELAWQACSTLWGAVTGTGTVDCPLRFPGQYADPESGLHYNVLRHYDPATARYVSPDPLGLGGGPDPHAYVPNPTRWLDPLGLTPCGTELYRGMREADGLPVTGPTARTLGARPGVDVPVGPDGMVHPGTGGVSVSPDSPLNLPPHRRPPEFGGTGRDPVWRLDERDLPDGLSYPPAPCR